MVRTALALALALAFALSDDAFASRKVFANLYPNEVVELSITNPSTKTQTLDVKIISRGALKIRPYSWEHGSTAWHPSVGCDSANKVCDLLPTFRTLSPGESISLMVDAYGPGGTQPPRPTLLYEITVQEPDGFVIARGRNYPTEEFTINGGHPF